MRCAGRRPSRTWCGALALGAALLCACSHGLPIRMPSLGTSRITEEELRDQVLAASSRFAAAITGAADTIEARATTPTIRRRALLWKVRIIPLVQRAPSSPRATEGLLLLLALSAAQHQYLSEGNGASLFGDQQELAQRTAREIETDLAVLPEQLLDRSQAEALVAQVDQFSDRHPITGEFAIATPQSVRADLQRFGSFQKVLELPLTPFRALEGLDSGAGSIRDFNGTARQFNELLAGLPQQARWQLQLLLYDLESRESLQRGLASMERIADSSERFSVAFEHLPETTRQELTAFLDESPQSPRELRATIAAASEAVARADGALERVDGIAHRLESVAAGVARAGDSWAEVVREVKREKRPDVAARPPDTERPFDIGEYERTARAVQDAAVEIRGALAQLPSGAEWSGLVDRVFVRALALMLSGFGSMLAYRVLLRRLAPEPRSMHPRRG